MGRRPAGRRPIGPVLDAIHSALDGWLGNPQWKQTEGRVTLTYRFDSEDIPSARSKVKVEINSREHFTALGLCIFTADMTPLLAAGTNWDFDAAYDLVRRELLSRLSGEPPKGG